MSEVRSEDRVSKWRRPLFVTMLILLLTLLATTGPTAYRWVRYKQQWFRVNGVIGSVQVDRFGGTVDGPILIWRESNGALLASGEANQDGAKLTTTGPYPANISGPDPWSLDSVRNSADLLVQQDARFSKLYGPAPSLSGEIPESTPPAPWMTEGLDPEAWWALQGE